MAKQVVLVVDDDADTLELMQILVEDIVGASAALASDGKQALQLFEELNPALVILDIKLPLVDGLEVVRQLRAGPAIRHVPIIALTASRKSCQEAMKAGCDDFLEKPFELDYLLEKVRNHLHDR